MCNKILMYVCFNCMYYSICFYITSNKRTCKIQGLLWHFYLYPDTLSRCSNNLKYSDIPRKNEWKWKWMTLRVKGKKYKEINSYEFICLERSTKYMTLSCRWYQSNGKVLKNWRKGCMHPNLYNGPVLWEDATCI